jgi:hypothetical protein
MSDRRMADFVGMAKADAEAKTKAKAELIARIEQSILTSTRSSLAPGDDTSSGTSFLAPGSPSSGVRQNAGNHFFFTIS